MTIYSFNVMASSTHLHFPSAKENMASTIFSLTVSSIEASTLIILYTTASMTLLTISSTVPLCMLFLLLLILDFLALRLTSSSYTCVYYCSIVRSCFLSFSHNQVSFFSLYMSYIYKWSCGSIIIIIIHYAMLTIQPHHYISTYKYQIH